MARLQHFYGQNHLHYLTANIYRKARIFDSERYKSKFIQTLGNLRTELGFKIIGYVLMPEHCHLLISPGPPANPSQIMQKLSECTANFILRNLRQNVSFPWCQRMLKRFELPPAVHHHAHCRVWNRRGYDMNVWSEKKIHEKFDYMYNNPVVRGLVAQPGNWRWSSWRHYCLEDSSVLAMDRMPFQDEGHRSQPKPVGPIRHPGLVVDQSK
jgi:putative transposase